MLRIFPVAALCLLAFLPWQVVSAGEVSGVFSQVMAKKQGDLKMLKDMLWLMSAVVLFCALSASVMIGSSAVSKKLAKRRERQAEQTRSK